MVTPVTETGRIDTAAVERIIEFFAQNGVSPLLMGTTGEGNSVSREGGVLLVETAAKTARGRMTVYAGLTGNCLEEQLVQAEAYFKAGADVIAATLPSYYALTPEQMENYYTTLADHLSGPLMLYNILATTHMSIPLDVIGRLSRHPNIVGLKDSERDEERMAKSIALFKDRTDFSYFCGCAAYSARSLALGGDGIVPSTGNFVPELYQQLYTAARQGDHDKAARLQEETNRISKVYQEGRILGRQLAALKVIMHARSLCDVWMLPPLTCLTPEEEAALASDTRLQPQPVD